MKNMTIKQIRRRNNIIHATATATAVIVAVSSIFILKNSCKTSAQSLETHYATVLSSKEDMQYNLGANSGFSDTHIFDVKTMGENAYITPDGFKEMINLHIIYDNNSSTYINDDSKLSYAGNYTIAKRDNLSKSLIVVDEAEYASLNASPKKLAIIKFTDNATNHISHMKGFRHLIYL